MSDIPLTTSRVTVWDLRRLFNEGGFIKQLRNQELKAQNIKCNTVEASSPNISPRIPLGSVSQQLRLYDANNIEVARMHRYIKPDGLIGASGKNDPKRLTINNVVFHQAKEGCPVSKLSNQQINTILKKRGLAAAPTYVAPYYYRFQHAIEKLRNRFP